MKQKLHRDRPNLMLFWLLLVVLTCSDAYSQGGLALQGKVTAEGGEALPGVSVLLKGTSQGTTTDTEGQYRMAVPDRNSILVVSFIGYVTQEVTVGNRTTVDVILLPDVMSLNEVVVTGYTTQSKATLTTAISKVDTRELVNTPNVNPVTALQGKVAGLSVAVVSGQPGITTPIVIRGGTGTQPYGQGTGGGRTSANRTGGDSNPLYVIDGVFRYDMNDINPNDIESIQVLKDAASTAIYGARGANGVVVVTTKKGTIGQKGRLTFSYQHGIETFNRNRGYQFASGRDYLLKARSAALAAINDPNSVAGRASNGAFMYSTVRINNPGDYGKQRYTPVFLDDLTRIEGQGYVDNLVNNQGYETITDPITGKTILFKDNHYQDVVWQTAHTNNYNFGFDGGTDRANYNMSLGYVKQGGTYIGTDYSRLSLLSNAGYKIKDNLRADIGFSYQWNDNKYVRDYTGLTRSVRVPTTWRLYYDDGTPGVGENDGSPRNRLHELAYQNLKANTSRFTTRLGFDYEILPGLHFRPGVNYYKELFDEEFFQRRYPRDLAGNNFNSNRDMTYFRSAADQVVADGLLTYDFSLAGKHNFNALAGINYTYDSYFDLNVSGRNAPTDYVWAITAAPANSAVNIGTRNVGGNNKNQTKLLSYFGQVNYNYDGRYLLGVSGRYDGSSLFAEKNKFAFFPSVSAGWNVHREAFWADVPTISSLKLRASWGAAGSLSNLGYADAQGLYSSLSYGGSAGILNTQLGNPNIVWETTKTTDLAADLGFFNNRLTLTVDLYNKRSEDRLFNLPLPVETGFGSIRQNVGVVQNRGVEVAIGGTVFNQGEFRWETNFTFAFNRTTVVRLPDNGVAKNRINGGPIWDAAKGEYVDAGGLAEGERVGGLWAWNITGVYATDAAARAPDVPKDLGVSGGKQGKPKNGGDAIFQDVDGNGVIDTRDLVFMGWRVPDKIGGFVNTFSYKGLTLRVVTDYALGHVINNGPLARGMANGRNNEAMPQLAVTDASWQKSGDDAKYARWDNASDFDNGYRQHLRFITGAGGRAGLGLDDSYGSDISTYYEKGDFLAFREVSLAYRVPQSVLQKARIASLTLNAGIYNIGYLTKYTGLTPEIYQGFDSGTYPRPRQFTFGATFGF